MSFRILFAFSIVFPFVCDTVHVHAQPREQIRRDLRTPGLVVETGAPTSRCWSLRFSSNGNELLAAGLDKVVRQWSVGENRFDRSDAKIFRWAAYREQRGTIFCTALSHDPEQRYLAVAGWGLRNGSIAVIDRSSGEVLFGSKYQLGLQPVYAVTFSSNNEKIFFGTFDGSVGTWDYRTGNVESLGRHNTSLENNPVWSVFSDGEDSYESLAEDGSWFRWNSGGRPPEKLPSFDMEVNYAAVSAEGSTVAVSGFRPAGKEYAVEIRSMKSPRPEGRTVSFPVEETPKSLALDNVGKTLAVVFEKRKTSTVRLYEADTGRDRGVVAEFEGTVESIAFHPSGKILAIAGGKKDGLIFLDLTDRKILDTLESSGRSLGDIAFNANAATIGEMFAFQSGGVRENAHVFDLAAKNWAKPSRAAEFQAVPALKTLDGWGLVVEENDSHKRYRVVHARTGESRRVPTLPEIDFEPTCYTFLPKSATETGVRLVVGHTWGASLFQVVSGSEPKLLRRFVGHQGEVLDVAFSEDGRRLATTGRDQTIAVWSLDPWPNQSELGVDFSVRNNRLTVAQVAPGSPGWEAKLEPGDEIIRLREDAREVQGGPEAWRRVLENPVPGKELVFNLRRTGEPEEIVTLTTVRQRPLWKFFSTEDGEWVLWRWRDYYYDCSTRGDDWIGWQINTEIDVTPIFVTAEQFRSRFHRPDKVAEILARDIVSPERIADFEMRPPKLRLESSPEGPDRWRISLRAEDDHDRFIAPPREVCLWINDHKVKRWLKTPANFREEFVIEAGQLRRGENFLIAQAYAENDVRGDSELVNLSKPVETVEKPRLFALSVGINDYAGVTESTRKIIHDLRYCREDGDSIFQTLTAQTTGAFRPGKIVSLTDREATRENIVKALRGLSQEATPDDFFVLFMAGHGWSRPRPGKAEEFDPATFALVTADFDLSAPEKTGLSFLSPGGESLYDLLTGISAHKAVLLDCCHSGSILGKDTNLIRSLIPERLGPIVLVACDKDEQAWPIPELGHGTFTAAVLEAFEDSFEKADTDGNARLSGEELALWVTDRVPLLIERARYQLHELPRSQSQHPQVFLPRIRPDHLYFQQVRSDLEGAR